MTEPQRTLTRQQTADIATARGTILRAVAGYEDMDWPTAAAMLDRALATACRHDPEGWQTGDDSGTGRPLVTCRACGVSWFDDYPERLAHVTSYAGGEG